MKCHFYLVRVAIIINHFAIFLTSSRVLFRVFKTIHEAHYRLWNIFYFQTLFCTRLSNYPLNVRVIKFHFPPVCVFRTCSKHVPILSFDEGQTICVLLRARSLWHARVNMAL